MDHDDEIEQPQHQPPQHQQHPPKPQPQPQASQSEGLTRRARPRKYLVYDGLIATNAERVYHRFPMLVSPILELVGLAAATDRILVLPALLHMQSMRHVWEMLDAASLDRFVAWRPASFFDTLRARHANRDVRDVAAGRAGAWRNLTAAQLMLRGPQGAAVRWLSASEGLAEATWYEVKDGEGLASVRAQEWAVARGAAGGATVLFVRIRRDVAALVSQPCLTNPAAWCAQPVAERRSWLEYHLHHALHWCHYRTERDVELPNDREKGRPAGRKREWEHFDRYKAGPFIRPVDECAWPKRTVWPAAPPSLTSRLLTRAVATAGGGTGREAAWSAAAAHPCFAAAVQAIARGLGTGGTGSNGGSEQRRLAVLSAALWVRHEWAASMGELADLGRFDPKAVTPQPGRPPAVFLLQQALMTVLNSQPQDPSGACASVMSGLSSES
jgi:hypothetical protein